MNDPRHQIPALHQRVHDHDLIYFDHAATTHMPQSVLNSMIEAMTVQHGNVRRGVHQGATLSTQLYEQSRAKIARFIGAKNSEVVCTSGTTQGLNMVAHCAGEGLQSGDTVLLSVLAHHAHLLPWQAVASRRGLSLQCVPIDPKGMLSLSHIESYLKKGGVKIIALPFISNVLGVEQPIREVVSLAKTYGAKVVIDAAQAAAHRPIDVHEMGVDALVFGSHKMFGPTGAGVMWVKEDWLSCWAPFVVGGGSVETVSFEQSTFLEPPYRFESGTPNVAGMVGMAAAADWILSIGWEKIQAKERKLRDKMRSALMKRECITLMACEPDIPLFSFVVDNVHAHDVGTMLDFCGIAVRTGQHCAAPLHEFWGFAATTRASLSFLNTFGECDTFMEALDSIFKQLGVSQ